MLHSLLNAASTIAVTREAKAQETFNMVAAVGGVMFGVPALVLSLYGATAVLPLRAGNAIVILPLAVAGLGAALIAALLPGLRRTGKTRRFSVALAAVLTILIILISAGTLVVPGHDLETVSWPGRWFEHGGCTGLAAAGRRVDHVRGGRVLVVGA